ncbi:hypothetical protein BO1005MUT1_180100 [Hyphomicrobiales bacterium]|nr:hypothetical protein BO1005MUT1_180100 [Hyphomicrobiales bacterium]
MDRCPIGRIRHCERQRSNPGAAALYVPLDCFVASLLAMTGPFLPAIPPERPTLLFHRQTAPLSTEPSCCPFLRAA